MPTIQFLPLDRSWRGNSDSPGGQWFSHATKHEQQKLQKYRHHQPPYPSKLWKFCISSFSLRYETNQPNPWVSQISWLNQGHPPWDSSQVWNNLRACWTHDFCGEKTRKVSKKQQLLKCTSSGSTKTALKKTMGCLMVLPDPTMISDDANKKRGIWWLSMASPGLWFQRRFQRRFRCHGHAMKQKVIL